MSAYVHANLHVWWATLLPVCHRLQNFTWIIPPTCLNLRWRSTHKPFVIWVTHFSIWQCFDGFTFSLTDLQNVNITLRILFRPLADKLPQIYTNLGSDYDERVLPSIVNEVLKAVVVSVQLSVVNFKHINVFCHLYYHSYLMT